MAKKNHLTDEDLRIFREAMRDVTPLTHSKILRESPSPAFRRRQTTTEPHERPVFEFSDYEILEPVSTEATIEFARSGVQYKTLRKMRQGEYNVDAVLDLHGRTTDEARQVLSHFLLNCQEQAIRHVLIIHGKGRDCHKPVLKNKLNHWLRQTEQVLAFCSASAKDGRSGALYVLLRR